jgi:CO/xanthine dehydrogenase FAD-binding subunit
VGRGVIRDKSYRPETLDELLEIINMEDTNIFAGGTDLMIRKRQWQGAERRFDKSVVFINQISELRGIKEFEDRIEIGTTTSHREICDSNLPEYIKCVYRKMGNPPIRNMATVGGNIVNSAKVADSLPLLYCLEAKVKLESKGGERTIAIEKFILDKYKTDIKKNEVLTKIIIPKINVIDYSYRKVGQRKASILSKVSVLLIRTDNDIRISIGAVNPIVIRDKEIEIFFVETSDVEGTLIKYKNIMKGEDDNRSSRRYREKIASNILLDFLRGE